MWLSLTTLLFTIAPSISAVLQQAVLDWACESVNQTKCAFDGCCKSPLPRCPAAPPAPSVLIDPQGDPSTYCGTFGTMNQTGCCPLNETCSGVGRCPPGDTECPGGGCCPSGAVCVAEGDGTLACDYGPRPDDYLVGQALVKSAGGVFLPMLILVGGGVGAVVVVNS